MIKNGLVALCLLSTTLFADFTLSGNVSSDNKKLLSTRNMGYVTNVFFNEGDYVLKGDKLLSIDTKEIDMKKEQLLNVLAIQQADYDNVLLNLNRYKRLLKEDMVSKYEVEQLELGLFKLKKSLNITNNRLQEVNNQYNYLNIVAPNSGLISVINYKVGELTIPAMPAIVLTDERDLKVFVEVPENKISKIKKGDEVFVEIENSGEFTGNIFSIVKDLNPISHTFKVKISISKLFGKGDIFPGSFAKVTFKD